MNFEFKSVNAQLADIFTVLPPSYQGWLGKTQMEGSAALRFAIGDTFTPWKWQRYVPYQQSAGD